MNKSNLKVVKNYWRSCKDLQRGYEQILNKLWAIHEQDINKSWISHKQIMNKSWESDGKGSRKNSGISKSNSWNFI